MAIDRETPTPRQTDMWALHEDHAHALSEQLRSFAQAEGSVLRSRRLRDLSDVAEDYARAFRRWSLEDVPSAVKMGERSAFSLFSQGAEEEMRPSGHPTRLERLLVIAEAALAGDLEPLRAWGAAGKP